MALLFFKPIFKERIWGGDYFKKELGYPLDDKTYGELWSVSAHFEGLVEITNGPFKGLTLKECYEKRQDLFGTKTTEFPLMVKLIHTADDLSVQIHPNDEYAQKYEKQFGKSECWYFLEAAEKSTIIIGHHAKSKEEIKQALEQHKILQLLNEIPVKTDDFVLIEAGTIHALKKGLLVVEIQQSSDVTYRLYDYDRVDKNGLKRPLHLKKSLDVIDLTSQGGVISNYGEADFGQTKLLDYQKFKVDLLKIERFYQYEIPTDKFVIFTVISGHIMVEDEFVKMGESFIALNNQKSVLINGTGRILVSYL